MKFLHAKLFSLIISLALLLPTSIIAQQNADPFIVKPYLQIGDTTTAAPNCLTILWHTTLVDARWQVEHRAILASKWVIDPVPTSHPIIVGATTPHFVISAEMRDLIPGAEYQYRVMNNGQLVFLASFHARKSASQPSRFIVFGDCAEGTSGQKAIAYQTWKLKPDFVFIPGDIVYTHGSIDEYRRLFFPIYNNETASPDTGAPLLRSTLFMACLGNHDVDGRNLDSFPDGLAYYYYWSQPLNGPLGQLNAPNTPKAIGSNANLRAFLSAAQPNYPKMANYSFNYGNMHWTVLDANPYADWTRPPLLSWLEKDLAASISAKWRFVTFHQPGFVENSNTLDIGRISAVARLLEKYKVDIVFNGHIHTYICSRPLKLGGVSSGLTTPAIDTVFDGIKNTRPKGVIYMVTGAGGAHLHNLGIKESIYWQILGRKFIPGIHSLTCVDNRGPSLLVRQIDSKGKEIDRFVITK